PGALDGLPHDHRGVPLPVRRFEPAVRRPQVDEHQRPGDVVPRGPPELRRQLGRPEDGQPSVRRLLDAGRRHLLGVQQHLHRHVRRLQLGGRHEPGRLHRRQQQHHARRRELAELQRPAHVDQRPRGLRRDHHPAELEDQPEGRPARPDRRHDLQHGLHHVGRRDPLLPQPGLQLRLQEQAPRRGQLHLRRRLGALPQGDHLAPDLRRRPDAGQRRDPRRARL
ncbi:hypothetical protein HK102_012469, partial [Quaeritorhiza haematococci]